MTDKPIVLHLGCSNEPLPEKIFKSIFPAGVQEVRIDIDPHCRHDITADIRNLPIEDQSVAGVFSSHVLEHFDCRERHALIKEWRRVVKHNGIIYVVVPRIDSAEVIKSLQLGDADRVIYDSPAGDITAGLLLYGQFYPGQYEVHKWGYTKKTLIAFLRGYLDRVECLEQDHQLCCYGWVRQESGQNGIQGG